MVDTEEKIENPKIVKEEQTKNDYSIFDYLKEHTAFSVTFVSAMVAVVSFVLNYANARFNHSYLNYWGIDTVYAMSDNTSQLYVVLCSFLFCVALMLIHGLLSSTSDAYRHYNKLLSTLKWQCRNSRALARRIRKYKKEIKRALNKIAAKDNPKELLEDCREKIQNADNELAEISDLIQSSVKAQKDYRRWMYFNIGIAFFVAYAIGIIFLLFTRMTITWKDVGSSALVALSIILGDLLLYFLPAYFASRCTKKKYENQYVLKIVEDMMDYEKHRFPVDNIIHNGWKVMVSNSKMKYAAGQFVIAMIIVVFLMSYSGVNSASTKKSFPIYNDASTTYAIVYNNGTEIIMEEAVVNDNSIIIDKSKQKVVESVNISYEVKMFEEVAVIGN